MRVQLSSAEGLPETVKARKRPLLTAVAIICHLLLGFFPFHFTYFLHQTGSMYICFMMIQLCTGHVQVINCF